MVLQLKSSTKNRIRLRENPVSGTSFKITQVKQITSLAGLVDFLFS